MRETIVCIGQIGKTPYRFPKTDICVSSYEEICCYLSQHLICYLDTLPEEELLVYMLEELGLEKLYRQLIKYKSPEKDQMKYFATLFREGNYFTEEEIRVILDHYRALKNEPQEKKCKRLGDMLLNYGKTSSAILCYDEALKIIGEEGTEAGKLFHNRGVAQARLFRFEDAKIDFLKAYQKGGDENSLFHYYGILVFHDGDFAKAAEEMKSFHISDLLMESFEERFASMVEEQKYIDDAAKYHKMVYFNVNNREEDARRYFEALVKEKKKAFRKQLDCD